jgi:hypothetical protein
MGIFCNHFNFAIKFIVCASELLQHESDNNDIELARVPHDYLLEPILDRKSQPGYMTVLISILEDILVEFHHHDCDIISC